MDPDDIINRIKPLALKDGFTEKEVDALMNSSKIFTSKIIREYLQYVIKEELENKDDIKTLKFKKLNKKLMKIQVSNHVGCLQIQFKNLEELILVIQIGIANKETHKFDILFPNKESLKAIFFHIKKIMEMTNGYYKNMMLCNKQFFRLLCDYIPNVDFSELKLNYDSWTMAFSADHLFRIVPVVYFTDKAGHPVNLDDVDNREPKKIQNFK